MEPRIQYAKTSDGVSIAYSSLGEGTALVYMPYVPVFSHLQMEWQIPEMRRWFEGLAAATTLVRYDARGMGLSDRDVTDFSANGMIADMEAVVNRLGLERFALYAHANSGPIAVTYAATKPERVSHLIMWATSARGSEGPGGRVGERARTLRALADKDWEMYTETWANAMFGWSAGESARQAAKLRRESTSPEVSQAMWSAFDEIDANDLLPQVQAPTLVLDHQENPISSGRSVRGTASAIPDARMVLLEGRGEQPWRGDSGVVVRVIHEFLGVSADNWVPEVPEGMAVLLFTDIANSTALTEQLGDAEFRSKARKLDTSLRAIIGESGGTPVEGKVLGDGVLAVFTSARQAIDCALRCNANSEPLELQLHLGIHAGDVIREGNNVYGGAVNIAARIAGAADPGEVLVSDTVRSLARTSAGVAFDDRGEHSLKGVADPQRLFAVRGAD